jgi:hypothetical protein
MAGWLADRLAGWWAGWLVGLLVSIATGNITGFPQLPSAVISFRVSSFRVPSTGWLVGWLVSCCEKVALLRIRVPKVRTPDASARVGHPIEGRRR